MHGQEGQFGVDLVQAGVARAGLLDLEDPLAKAPCLPAAPWPVRRRHSSVASACVSASSACLGGIMNTLDPARRSRALAAVSAKAASRRR